MKKITIQTKVIFCFIILVLSSCSSAELEYNEKEWKHKSRMLDIEYERSVINLKNEAEMNLLINKLDSIAEDLQK
jgi:hypothetical protein